MVLQIVNPEGVDDRTADNLFRQKRRHFETSDHRSDAGFLCAAALRATKLHTFRAELCVSNDRVSDATVVFTSPEAILDTCLLVVWYLIAIKSSPVLQGRAGYGILSSQFTQHYMLSFPSSQSSIT